MKAPDRVSTFQRLGTKQRRPRFRWSINKKECAMPQEKPGPHHDHPGHTPGDLDEHGHRDRSVKEEPGPHHDHPGHQPGDLDEHGHRDKSAPPKP